MDGGNSPTGSGMDVVVNGETTTVGARTLTELLTSLGYGDARVATAVDGAFVPAAARAAVQLRTGMRIEIVAPRQGG